LSGSDSGPSTRRSSARRLRHRAAARRNRVTHQCETADSRCITRCEPDANRAQSCHGRRGRPTAGRLDYSVGDKCGLKADSSSGFIGGYDVNADALPAAPGKRPTPIPGQRNAARHRGALRLEKSARGPAPTRCSPSRWQYRRFALRVEPTRQIMRIGVIQEAVHHSLGHCPK